MKGQLKTTRLSLGTIFLTVFVLTSAGPFGVEEMVSATGPGLALVLILGTPLVWGAPLALVCAEMASAIPEEGGAYAWVERALGPFWAFQAGWWSSVSGLVDTALYVVLAVTYANGWLALPQGLTWVMSFAIIVFFAALNVRGLRVMAVSSAGFAIVILVPCVALTVLGLSAWEHDPFAPFLRPDQPVATSLGLGLTVAIWFYSGYESMSTMAGEVAEPQRVIPKALLLSLPVVVAVYFLPTLAGLASVGRWSEWSPENGLSLADIARDLGGASFVGTALGAATMAGAIVSSLALYNAYLASGARTTLVMARRRHLPAAFARVHPRFGTPYGSIVIAAILHAILATGSFAFLIVIDVLLFVLSYLLIFVAAVVLRVKEPRLARPFRVPTGTAGMVAIAGVPTLVALAFLVASGLATLAWGMVAAATGPVAYVLSTRLTRDPRAAERASVAEGSPAP
jgi:amino acid transporter